VRFDSARAAGLDEAKAGLIADGYEQVLDVRESLALGLTDAIVGAPQTMTDELRAQLQQEFSPAELVELSMGVGLFLGMSKVLILLGLEPENMPVTVLPTPGS